MDASFSQEIFDLLLRSRHTLLDILDERGYETKAYRNISPEQIAILGSGEARALDIVVPRKKEDTTAPCDRAVVVYLLNISIRKSVEKAFLRDTIGDEVADEVVPNQADDITFILNEPYNEVFDKVSLQWWQTKKIRVRFFHIKQVVVHLGRHVLVPPHRKLTADEIKVEMEKMYITQKSQFPLIKHSDIQARILGLVPGDLVEIQRPSPTAGFLRFLRICAA